jgi:hypothetical protein
MRTRARAHREHVAHKEEFDVVPFFTVITLGARERRDQARDEGTTEAQQIVKCRQAQA